MIILSRKRNESVVIGGEIVVTVIDIRGDKARLGIDAPSECSIHRREIWTAINQPDVTGPSTAPRPRDSTTDPIDQRAEL